MKQFLRRFMPNKKWKYVRLLRGYIRHPQLWALLSRSAVPCSFSASKKSQLRRPESIQISRSGKRALVSNSSGQSITVYDIDWRNQAKPKLRLIDYFADKKLLHYAHGATFACSDQLYLVLGEFSNTLSAISANIPRTTPESSVLWSLKGVANGLDSPADIAIHPSQRYLVIANRLASGLCFLSIDADLLSAPPQLASSLTVKELNQMGIAAPHGVAFSSDGRYLFATHKRFVMMKSNVVDTGNSAITAYRADMETYEKGHWTPLATKDYGSDSLHHIACHPTDNIIAFTNSTGPVTIMSWDAESHEFRDIGKINVFRQGEGVKGICFTQNGSHLAVTSEFDEVLFFSLQSHT
jgi:6-phosphogluconolactonase (cycloisomerase 2 family)